MKNIVDFSKKILYFRNKTNKHINKGLSYSDIGMTFFIFVSILLSCSIVYISVEKNINGEYKSLISYQEKRLEKNLAINEVDLEIIDNKKVDKEWSEIISDINPFNLKYAEAALQEVLPNKTDSSLLISPLIRIGLFYTTRQHKITSTGSYQVLNFNGSVLITSQGEIPVVIWFNKVNKTYNISSQNIQDSSLEPYKIVGENDSILKIESYQNPPKWNRSLSDNTFRGSLELNYSEYTGRIWMINELPLEDYLKGLSETRASDNFEYLKVMTVVGRSYAYYHMNDNYKHDSEYFHIDAYWDQVYRGYSNEDRHPFLVKAVEDTFGEVVTYQGEVAVTPYFARSNGQTKSWAEVWYGEPYPYVKPVSVPQEQGFSQLGHGVGLSAIGAMIMAQDGASYRDIVDYFYQDIEISKSY